MPERSRPPEDEQQLARPVGGEQEEATRAEEEQREAPRAEEERQKARRVEEGQEEKGLVEKAIDKAREKGLVGESMVEKAREAGLVGKAEEAINEVRDRLGSAVEKAREKAPMDKAEEAIDEARDKLPDEQIVCFEAGVEIERPVEEVFEYVTDPENLPEWASLVIEVRDVRIATPDLLREGDKFTAVAKFLGRRFETPCEVTDYLPNRQFSFRSTGGPVRQKFTYTFEPTLEGTRFTQSVEVEPGTFFRLAGPLFEAAGRRQINNDLETLRDLLEAEG